MPKASPAPEDADAAPTPLAPLLTDRASLTAVLGELSLLEEVMVLRTNRGAYHNPELWLFLACHHRIKVGDGQDAKKLVLEELLRQELAQKQSNEAADLGQGEFAGVDVTKRREHLEGIVARGGVGAEDAQQRLNGSAMHRVYFFEYVPLRERLAYLKAVVEQGTFGAAHAQEWLDRNFPG